MAAALEGGEWSAARPGRTLPPGKKRYPFYRRLGGLQGRSGRAENLVLTGIRSQTEYKWRYIILKRRYTPSLWSSSVTDRLRLKFVLYCVLLNNQQRATSLLQICVRTVLLMCLSFSFVAHIPSCDSSNLQRITSGRCMWGASYLILRSDCRSRLIFSAKKLAARLPSEGK